MTKLEIFDAIRTYLDDRGVRTFSFGPDLITVGNANLMYMEKTATLWVVSHHFKSKTFIIEIADPNMFEQLVEAIGQCDE